VKVIIEAALLVSAQVTRSPFALHALLHACLAHDCHYIEIDPPDAPELKAWRNTLRDLEREEFDLLLDESVQRESRDPSTTVIRVANVPTVDWSGTIPRLPLAQATSLLGKPLRVFLEGVNDEAFVRNAVPHIYRARFEEWSERDILRVEHKGGLQNLHHAIDLEALSQEQHLRVFVMIDSDARKRGEHSPESKRVARACERQGLPHHPLQRRAIDNYIPEPALEKWLKQHHARDFQEKWLPKLRAFRALSEEQRHHYNMKHGLKRDREGGALADIFEHLVREAPEQAGHLETGFTEAVAQCFRESIPEDWFRRDGQMPELMRLFETMLRAA
jgi:hypothetical protein